MNPEPAGLPPHVSQRLRVLVFVLLAAALAVTGYALYLLQAADIRRERQSDLAAIATLKAQQIIQWRRERLSDVTRLAEGPYFRSAVAELIAQPDNLLLRAQLHERLLVELVPGMDDAFVTDLEEHILLSAAVERDAADLMTTAAIQASLAATTSTLSDVYWGPDKVAHVDAVAPVFGEDGKPVAAVVLRTNPGEFLFPQLQEWPTRSASAEIYLVRREEDEAVYLNRARYQAPGTPRLRHPLSETWRPSVQAVLGKRGVVDAIDYRGRKVLADLRPVSGANWYLITKVDTDEFLAEAHQRGINIVLYVALGILLTGAILAHGHRQRQSHLLQRALDAERVRREAEEQFRITLYSIGDAVIVTGTDGRVRHMNAVAETLTGWSEEDVRGQPLANVFDIFEEETGAPAESPVARVLSQGSVVGLASHTILRARDGSLRPIADSGAPILGTGGAIIGVVLVFRDQTPEREAEAVLREREHQLRLFVEYSPAAIAMFDTEMRYIVASRRWNIDYNLGEQDLTGRSHYEVFPEISDQWRAIHQRCLAGAVETCDEDAFPRADGRVDYVRWEVHPWYRGDGAVGGVIMFTEVITARKRALEDLRQSEERTRLIVSTALDAVVIMDAAGLVAGWNAQAERTFGWSEADALGRPLEDLIIPHRHREGHRRGLEHYLATGEGPVLGRRIEIEATHRDGREFPVELAITPVRTADSVTFSAFIRDVTERKRAEAALREAEQRFRIALQNSPIAVFSQDRDLRYTWIYNPDPDSKPEDVIGKTDRELFPAESAERLDAIKGRVLETGETAREEVTIHRSGVTTYYDLTVEPLYDVKGMIAGVSCAAIDITPIRDAESARAALEEQLHLAQKMEAVGRLAGGVAHDFNNMLGVILGYAEVAADYVDPDSPVLSDLAAIMRAAEQAAALTRQLLAFARRQPAARELLDLNETASHSFQMLRRAVGEDVVFEWTPCAEPATVRMDPVQIDQILTNLILNARDAISGAGGRISVETITCEIDAAYAATHPDAVPGPYACLVVTDNGCGMDRATVDRIFEPFFTTKERDKGTGLGLPTVYGIVRQNGGFIHVTSEPGAGATFRVCLPREDAAPGAGARLADGARALAGTRTETVLLVEDEPALLRLGQRLLMRLGCTVLAAPAPEEALRIAAEHPGDIHLLVTDIIMPGMSGREVHKRVAALRPAIKCLYVSGYPSDAMDDESLLNPGIHFLQKPFTLETLEAKVREALSA